jgi:transcriptional regulator with XRE-family HTH domain
MSMANEQLTADERVMEHEFKMSLKKYLPVEDVREELRLLADSMSTHKALADKMGISPAYLHDVLAGRREPGPKVLSFLGLKRVVVYVEAE